MLPPLSAVLTGLLLPAALTAQTVVVGTLRDSLTGRPFAGATVQLVLQAAPGTTPRTVAADTAGRFRLTAVAPGRYLLGFDHPRLDSLGMDAPVRTVDVSTASGDVRADLALPSGASIATAVCGASHDSTGVVLGRVRDADRGAVVSGGAVVVQWGEVRVDATGVHHVVAHVRAPVGVDGRYAACGVPVEEPVLVSAAADVSRAEPADASSTPSAASGVIEVTIPASQSLLYRDLFVGPTGVPRRGTAALAGRVRRPNGTPLGGVQVVVLGARAADSAGVAGSDGTFRLDGLPGGTYAVEARAVGFAPARGAADLRAGRVAVLDLAFEAQVPTLDPVAVRGRADRTTDEFAADVREGRRQGGVYFLTGEQVDQRAPRYVSEALVTVPVLVRSTVTVDANGRQHLVLMGRASCAPAVYLNGVALPKGLTDLDEVVAPSEVRGIEVWGDGATPPPQYGGGGCASVVVWTKTRGR